MSICDFELHSWLRESGLWDMLKVGLPAGLEFALIFLYVLLVYGIIRDFGPAAQAGLIGARVMQALFLPVVASSRSV